MQPCLRCCKALLPRLAAYQSGTGLPRHNGRGHPQRENPDSIAIFKLKAEPLPQHAVGRQCKVQVNVCILDGAGMMEKAARSPTLSTHDRRQRVAGRRRYWRTIG